MRKVIDMQMKFGEVDIAKIKFDPRSRDEIPKLLMGLQEIYCNRKIRDKVFTALQDLIPEGVDQNNGRRGMDLWKILVLGTLRLCCNWDYDKLMEIANNHKALRMMLGHSSLYDDYYYPLQTLKDNLSLFTPEVLDRINQIVLQHGHQLVGKKKDEGLRGSCDSFVVETDVHYPTDINLLFDAMRKVILLIMALCDDLGLSGWRKGVYNLKKVKRYFRKAQQLKRSTSKDKTTKSKREQLIIDAHMAYLELANSIVERAKDTIRCIRSTDLMVSVRIEEIQKYIAHAQRQMDQIRRRVVEGETIAHHEKVFSLFEDHTEWIKKGKAGVSQELGLKVCIVKDQFGFILHHRVMQHQTDDQIAVPIIKETKERFYQLTGCSFDKGFHSVETISATHEEYRHAMKQDMPMMIFVRGQHDTDRHTKTQAFFDEIKKDGHTYRRFHDRVDLIPEIKQGIVRILEESFSQKVDNFPDRKSDEAGKASQFEQKVLNVKHTKLDLEVAREWLKAVNEISGKKKTTRISILNKLREKGLVWKEAEGSVYKAMASGLLLLGQNPSEMFAQCQILADAYEGTEPDPNPKDQSTISEPAPRMIERVIDFVMSNTRHPIRIAGIRRLKLDEYPREVIRETIVNAIAHRDYEDTARKIYLKVFFDRVEILSPGNLLPPLTINKLIKGKYEPCSRNPTIAQYLGHLHLMEQRGSGIRRMQTAMIDHGLRTPAYIYRDGYFIVILWGPGDDINKIKPPVEPGIPASMEEQLTDRQRRIVEWLAAGKTVTNRECQEYFKISKVTATKELGTLVEVGFAEQIGKGRSIRYIFKGGNR